MHTATFAIVCLLACSGIFVTAKRVPVQTQNVEVNLSGGDTVTLQLREQRGVFAFSSKDKFLKKNGYASTKVFFDYRQSQGVMVVVAGKGKSATCFYMDVPMPQGDFQALLDGPVNRTEFDNAISVDGRGESLSKGDSKAWLKNNSFVRNYCSKSPLVELTVLAVDADLNETQTMKVFAVDRDVEIVVNEKEGNKKKGNDGKGNKGNGGKGNGGKGNGGKGNGGKGNGGKGNNGKGKGNGGKKPNGGNGSGGKDTSGGVSRPPIKIQARGMPGISNSGGASNIVSDNKGKAKNTKSKSKGSKKSKGKNSKGKGKSSKKTNADKGKGNEAKSGKGNKGKGKVNKNKGNKD